MNKIQLFFAHINLHQISPKTAFFNSSPHTSISFIYSLRVEVYKIDMTFQQKVINLTVILLSSLALYYISSQISSTHQSQQNFIHIMRAIGNGDGISDNMTKAIEQIAKRPDQDWYGNTPICFIKAYFEIVVKRGIKSQNLFTLFQQSNQEYGQISNCSQYIALLIFRAQKLQGAAKVQVMKVLLYLQKCWIKILYPKAGKLSQICVYLNSFNNEGSVKNQVGSITGQHYDHFKALIQNDGSTDNSPIFVKYTLEEANRQNIKFTQKNERQGVLAGLKQFMNQCTEDSIVLVLSEDETLLGDNALWIIDRIFSNSEIDLAFFGSLTSPHSNLQNIKGKDDFTSLLMPFVAFRKRFSSAISFEQSSKDFERNFLAYLLMKESTSRNGVPAQIIHQGLVYRGSRNSETELLRLEEVGSKWQ